MKNFTLRNNKRCSKLYVSVLFLLVSYIAYIVITTGTASGYEMSIYSAYPDVFWALMIVGFSLGIVALISDILVSKNHKIIVFLGVLCMYFILLNLHVFRGYALGDYKDSKAHLSDIYYILENARLAPYDFYPFIHALNSIYVDILNVSPELTISLSTFFIYSIFMVGFFLIGRSITGSIEGGYTLLGVSSVPIFWFPFLYVHPSGLSLLFIPYVLFLSIYSRMDQSREFILQIILIGGTIIFHPMTTFQLILLLSALLCMGYVSPNRTIEFQYQAPLVAIASILFIVWGLQFNSITSNLRSILVSYLIPQSPSSASTGATYLSRLNNSGLAIIDIFKLFMLSYGKLFLYLIPASVISLKILLTNTFKRRVSDRLLFSICFILLNIFGLIFLFGSPVSLGPTRLVKIPIMLSIILIGGYYYRISSNEKRGLRRMSFISNMSPIRIILITLILSSVILGVISFYPSPIQERRNYQTTNQEISMTSWLINHHQDNTEVVRAHTILDPTQFYVLKERRTAFHTKEETIPNQFGYDEENSKGMSDTLYDSYIVLSELDKNFPKIFPKEVRPRVTKYDDRSIARLESDPVADNIYSSGEFEIWKTDNKREE